MTDDVVPGSMEDQLNKLYEEKDLLDRELGVSTAEELIAMVKNLEAQLNDLYENLEE